MRKLRKISMAVVLTFALCASAFAGIIGTGPEPPPEPPPTTATGIIGTPPSDAQPVTPATDPVVDIALNLLQGALSLL